ncbi:dienelactone hydrolase family protein [Alteromonas sp. 1_MG-2023]|uniref:alpha/beta family hydrolase n=1 Tax=Alteromonas sp. 1_MG-2023 TaxID=3062669 RepID=UPI0026E16234|nr:alpha/beta family hydrolase [Alteromonas sp. 1_MG-2023]MDO6567411.1 dienelactone hydrolase family protein [Alteromonas sp. 1_MG-2023]
MFDFQIHSTNKNAAPPFARIILGHGAGAGMQHEFMQTMATILNGHGVEVVLFNFPYMQTIIETKKRRPPDRADKLLAHFNAVIQEIGTTRDSLPTFIGGKSMGGRMATMVLDDADGIAGAVALGYPFHPPGKPEKLRTAHLETLNKPLLIIQGERDTFGTKSEVENYNLSSMISFSFLEDGDHSFKPRKRSGFTLATHIECAAKQVADFMKAQTTMNV